MHVGQSVHIHISDFSAYTEQHSLLLQGIGGLDPHPLGIQEKLTSGHDSAIAKADLFDGCKQGQPKKDIKPE